MRRHHHFDKSNETSTQSIQHLNHLAPNQNNPASYTQNDAGNQNFGIYERINSIFIVILRHGFLDSLRIQVVLECLESKPDLRIRILQNSFLQLILIASMIGFQSFSEQRHSFWSALHFFFNVFWLLPIMFISIMLNNSISAKVMRKNVCTEEEGDQTIHKMIKLKIPNEIKNKIKVKVKSEYYKILFLLNYFLMSKGLLHIMPTSLLGICSSFCFCSIANSFYCFEQSWSQHGLNFEQKLNLLERRWDYHLGFGLLITLLTSIYPHHLIINLSIFTFFFPFLLILSTKKANEDKLNYTATNINKSNLNNKKKNYYFHQHSNKLPIFFISRVLNSLILKFNSSILQSNLSNDTHDFTHIEDGRDRFLN